MKTKKKHWFDLEKKERKDFKKLWQISPWRKAFNKSCMSEVYFINILLIIGMVLLSFLVFSFFDFIEYDVDIILFGAVSILIIFIPLFFIFGIYKEEIEFKKWLYEKFDVLK